MISPSAVVRTGIETRFGALFNDFLVAAFISADAPGQAFTINFDELADLPANFYREDRTIDELVLHDEPDLPALAMWIGEGQNLATEKPRLFSGHIVVYWRFFLFVAGIRKTGLVAQREAVEAAMLAVLDPEFSGFGYRGDLSWGNPAEKQILSRDESHFGWAQEIVFTGSLEVNL